MAKVALEQIGKSYGAVPAVIDLDLEIEDEEFVVLVGPSGCGKSTTLRLVAGLEEVTSGTIRIGQRVVNRLPPKDRDIAMVFQNYALYQHMTVYDNLAFGLRNRRTGEEMIRQEIARAAEMRDGRIQQVGTPLEIYNRPKNRFVAGFIGAPAMNFLDVRLEDAGGELYAVAPGFRIRVPNERAGVRNLSGDRALLLGVRPQHTLLGEPKPEHGTSFDAVVEVTEQLGAELLLGVRAAGRTLIASRIDPEIELHPHTPVRMSLAPRGLHFFDRDSGEALR